MEIPVWIQDGIFLTGRRSIDGSELFVHWNKASGTPVFLTGAPRPAPGFFSFIAVPCHQPCRLRQRTSCFHAYSVVMTCPIPDLAYLPLLSVFTFLPNSRCVLSSVASSVGRGSLLCHGFLHFCLFQGNPSKGKSCPEKKHLNAAPYLIPNGRQINCLQLHKGSKKLSSSINPKLAGT